MSDETKPGETTLGAVHEWDGGISWIAQPDEDAQRASHALSTAAGVWVVDPVDAEGLDERLAALGDVAGVVVVQDRHTRDAEAVAQRHDVSVFVPDWMRLVREKLETDAESVGSSLPGTEYDVHELIRTDDWEEAVLVDERTDTLVVPETLGTLPAFGGDGTDLGVHPAVDEPPESLAEWSPERVLVGHGSSVHSDANAELRRAIGAE